MKKSILFGLIGTALIGSFTNAANAADGTVNFTGNIIDQTCVIDTASKNQTVNLGQIYKSSLNGAVGKKSTDANFQLKLTSCPSSVKHVGVKFEGVVDKDNNKSLELTKVNGAATGVGIEIADKINYVYTPNVVSVMYPVTATGATLDFKARYVSTKAAVTSGPANAVAQITFVYF